MNKENKKSGFTLLEVIISIFILTTGILGVVGLITTTLRSAGDVKNRVVAANLAQEGIEITRQVRDTNWINNRDFDIGLEPTNGNAMCAQIDRENLFDCSADNYAIYKSTITPPGSSEFEAYTHESSGDNTPFSRTIEITQEINPEWCDDSGCNDLAANYYLKITSTVQWDNREVVVENHLYDWR